MREKQAFISALLAANLVAAFTLKDETKQSILKLWLAKGSAAEHCSIGPELQYSPNTKQPWDTPPKRETLCQAGIKGERHVIETDVASIPVLHLWGSPFEKGFAYGVLMGAEVLLALRKSEDYAIAQYKLACLDEFIWLPELFLQECAEHKLDHEYKQLLDNMWDYISDDTKIELNGMTEGVLMHTLHHPEIDKSELTEKILWMNLISESSESHGSMIGIFGKKINNESNLLIARTLDGDFENPLREFPQITVYHGHDTKTVFSPTWTGKLGLTFGLNEDGIAISASLVLLPDQSLFHPSGTESELEGKPIHMVVREALETCGSYKEVYEFMENNKRTLDAFVGVADTKEVENHAFKTLIYSNEVLEEYTQNQNDDHIIENTVYLGVDWECPKYNDALYKALSEVLADDGQITRENLRSDVLPSVQTGLRQSIIYSSKDNKLHLAIARPAKNYSNIEAYNQIYHVIDVGSMMNYSLHCYE